MICKYLTNVVDINLKKYLSCNKSTSQYDDFLLVENRGLATLKDLSIQWEKLPKKICKHDTLNS